MEADFGSKWGFLHSIYAAAQYDPTKIAAVTELNVNELFTYLTYMSEKNKVENNRMENLKRKR